MAGIYIHIPFCRKACTYCNFHFSTSFIQKDELVKSICREVSISENFIKPDETIDTVYFGGGTPSLLTTIDLQKIYNELQKKFIINPLAEITFEANPDDINPASLASWKSIGINRLSVGIQSFKEQELQWMNRAHNALQTLRCLDEIHEAGFYNFSVDLIFGSPLSDEEDLETNLSIIFERKIPHVSCYALTVEPKTALNTMITAKKSPPVSNEKQARQFLGLMDAMNGNNYEHYEISNFALPGFRSKHNSSYWNGTAYYGFGPSAHSFDGVNKRRWNTANNSLYIQSLFNNHIPYEEEILTDTQQLNEYIMTSIRTTEGVDIDVLKEKSGIKKWQTVNESIQKYIKDGRMIISDNHIRLTKDGKLFADGISADLFQ